MRDRIYIGDLEQHKYAKLNYKNKKTINIENNLHIITKNCHEPIISQELFYKVQEMLDKKSNEYNFTQNGITHLFRGLAFCGKCHAPVTYTKNHGKYFRGICSTYKKLGKDYCNNVNIREDYLIDTVLNDLKKTINAYIKQDDLKISKNINNDNSKQIFSINSKIKNNENYLLNLYKDKVDGKITDDMFKTLSERISKENISLEDNLKILTSTKTSETDDKEIKKLIKQALAFDKIDRNLLLKLIDKIEIDDKNNIKIFYNFKNPCSL